VVDNPSTAYLDIPSLVRTVWALPMGPSGLKCPEFRFKAF